MLHIKPNMHYMTYFNRYSIRIFQQKDYKKKNRPMNVVKNNLSQASAYVKWKSEQNKKKLKHSLLKQTLSARISPSYITKQYYPVISYV